MPALKKRRVSLIVLEGALSLLVLATSVDCSDGAKTKKDGGTDSDPDSGEDSGTDGGPDCSEVVSPRLIAPLSTKMVATRNPVLVWQGESDVAYVLEIASSYLFDDIEYSWTGENTSHEVADSLSVGPHFWRIYAEGCFAESVTPIWEFFAGMVPSDVNGDGYSDIVVSAGMGNDIRVFFGNGTPQATLSTTDANVTIQNDFPWGQSLSSWGDLDGDRIADIAIGNVFGCPRGAISICQGRESWNSTVTASSCNSISHYDTDATCVGFGDGVASSEDVDVDGVFDLVGAYVIDSSAADRSGSAWLFLSGNGNILSRTSTDDADVWITGEQYSQGFSSDSMAEDMNGDGRPEILFLDARAPSVGYDWIAESYIFWGRSEYSNNYTSGNLDVVFKEEGEDVGFWTGDAIGDFNGDGYGDIAVGYQPALGEHWMFIVGGGEALPAQMNSTSTQILTRIQHPGGFSADGYNIGMMGPGDLNGDGFDDFVFTLYGADSASPSSYDPLGAVYVIYGGSDVPGEILAENTDVIIKGNGDPWFGYSWGPLGDVNGDGYADIGISAVGDGPNDSDEFSGRVFVFFGGPTLDEKESASDADIIITSTNLNEWFGFCVNEDRGY